MSTQVLNDFAETRGEVTSWFFEEPRRRGHRDHLVPAPQDESEIQRVAVHFEVPKGPKGWRVVGVQALATDPTILADVWPR